MRIAVGTDIIEINRVKKSIERQKNKFLEKVYTDNEIKYCYSHGNNMYQHFAARFAAKEAAFKAISKIKNESTVDWKNFEVLNDKDGRPILDIKKYKFNDIDISLSHCKEYAIATVIILYDEKELD